MKRSQEKISPEQKDSLQVDLDVNAPMKEHELIIDFHSPDPKVCEAYVAAIADVIAGMHGESQEMKFQLMKEILVANKMEGVAMSGGHHQVFVHWLNENDIEAVRHFFPKIQAKAAELLK